MSETQAKTLAQFIAEHTITVATAIRIPERLDKDSASDWDASARHWVVTLARRNPKAGKRAITMNVPFSQGSAHTKPPTAADVLDCLASDAAGYDNAQSFEEWARDLGFDEDSRKAERTYRAVEKSAKDLRAFLGGQDAYLALLYEVERL